MSWKTVLPMCAACAIVALSATPARATRIHDLVRIKGHEQNVLTGMGIVVGLDGTGDNSKYSLAAARPYAQLLANLGNKVAGVEELQRANAIAIVEVTMRVPATGVREGDRIDVSVSTLYNATSLQGGRLVVSPLRLPRPDSPELVPLAIAEGPLVIEGLNPRNGIVRGGGQMLVDVRTNPVSRAGTMTLVLKDEYAGYPVATTIAQAINDEFVSPGWPDLAVVEDAKNVRVLVPRDQRPYPASFIATLETIPVDPSLIQTEARIVINEERGTIVVTGNVEIGPVGITHEGLTIANISPPPGTAAVGAPGAPAIDPLAPRTWAGLDTTGGGTRSSTRLVELLAAFDQLNVPVRDQIAIVHELKRSGALHAEIVTR
jgi:flagellar P-ring protein precursor FlgI